MDQCISLLISGRENKVISKLSVYSRCWSKLSILFYD